MDHIPRVKRSQPYRDVSRILADISERHRAGFKLLMQATARAVVHYKVDGIARCALKKRVNLYNIGMLCTA
jgi:hypothetical protein